MASLFTLTLSPHTEIGRCIDVGCCASWAGLRRTARNHSAGSTTRTDWRTRSERLELAGFARADLSLPEASPPVERSTPESGAEPPYTDDDAGTARTLHTSGAASVAALAAAGITVATGGAAAPAFAAAIGAGALAGGATFAVTKSADDQEQHERDAKASAGELLLSVRARTRRSGPRRKASCAPPVRWRCAPRIAEAGARIGTAGPAGCGSRASHVR